jgi:hypothetical protein
MGLCNRRITKEKILFFFKTEDDWSSSCFLHLFRGLFRLWDVGCLGDCVKAYLNELTRDFLHSGILETHGLRELI